MGRIIRRDFKHTREPVYYYRRSYRVKVDPKDGGKVRGSGPSKVKTEEVYLGTAEEILERVRGGEKPYRARTRELGVVCAALEMARQLQIAEIVDRHVPKRDQGLSVGTYVVLAALNKIDAATSRSGIADWYSRTVLPEHLGVGGELLKSQNFWDAFEKILPQRQVEARVWLHQRGALSEDEVFEPGAIERIEQAVWERVIECFQVPLDCVLYDNTNFFTYYSAENPSALAQTGHSKAGRSEKRQVGLSTAVTQEGGLPLFHLLYRGNRSEARLFPESLSRMMDRFTRLARGTEKVLVVVDRASNSRENVNRVREHERCNLLGALVPSQHDDLMRIPLVKYQPLGALQVHRTRKAVYGLEATIVLVFNERTYRKKLRQLEEGIEELKAALKRKFEKVKRRPIGRIREALAKVHRDSRWRRFVHWEVQGKRHKSLVVRIDRKVKNARVRTLGKRALFTDRHDLSTATIVRFYDQEKHKVEDAFKELKNPDLIRIQPVYHWTDSKLKVYALVCALAYLLLKLMAYQLKRKGLEMSLKAMMMALREIKEVVLVYGFERVVRVATERTSLQEEMGRVLGLDKYYPAG